MSPMRDRKKLSTLSTSSLNASKNSASAATLSSEVGLREGLRENGVEFDLPLQIKIGCGENLDLDELQSIALDHGWRTSLTIAQAIFSAACNRSILL